MYKCHAKKKKKGEFGFETVNVGFTNVLYKCS